MINTALCQEEAVEPRRVIPAVFERPAVPERDEHVVGSTTASMNQLPAAGQAGPSGPPEGAQVPGLFMVEKWHILHR